MAASISNAVPSRFPTAQLAREPEIDEAKEKDRRHQQQYGEKSPGEQRSVVTKERLAGNVERRPEQDHARPADAPEYHPAAVDAGFLDGREFLRGLRVEHVK